MSKKRLSMRNDSTNELQLSRDNSDVESLLYEALSAKNIPIPNSIKSNGYTRWGHKSRYWLTAMPNRYRFGDHSEQSSYNVFFDKIAGNDRWCEACKVEEDKEEQYAKAALKAVTRWKRGKHAEDQSYMLNKKIQSCMLKVDNYGNLMVPVFYFGNNIVSLQYIDAEGNKRFMRGGRVVGCYHPIGELKNRILLCEGVATGYSIYQATKELTVCCFGTKNLMPVAERFKRYYQDTEIIICADNDKSTEESTGRNPGLETAKEAAIAINSAVTYPIFKNLEGKLSDFNDLHCREGIDVVRKQIVIAYGVNNEQ